MSTDLRLERDIQQAIEVELGDRNRYPDLRLWPNVIGDFVDNRGNYRKVGVARPGGSDLVGIFKRKDGVGMWIGAEIKSAVGRQSDEQKLHEQAIRELGGEYAVLRSVDDARQWVARLRGE